MAHKTDVIVIGAGASGLRLAGLLAKANISAVVLEARDRIGGRLLTTEPGVDLGATWFWQNESDVLQVISECSLESFPQHAAGNMMYQAQGAVQELDGNPFDQQAWRIAGGMQKLAMRLEKALPAGTVQLSTEVSEIRCDEHITVVTNQGEWTAQHVVIALPPALAMANISFTPALPRDVVHTASNTPVWMGATKKVVALYDTPFWRERGLAGSAMSYMGPLREIHDISDHEGNFGALFGFSRDPINEEAVLTQLAALFGEEAASLQSLVMKDWSDSKFTSPANVAELNNYQFFGARELTESHMNGRLHFTSTETATDSPGHIQGALSAARRTADRIIASVR